MRGICYLAEIVFQCFKIGKHWSNGTYTFPAKQSTHNRYLLHLIQRFDGMQYIEDRFLGVFLHPFRNCHIIKSDVAKCFNLVFGGSFASRQGHHKILDAGGSYIRLHACPNHGCTHSGYFSGCDTANLAQRADAGNYIGD